MQKIGIKSSGPGAPMSVPAPGAVSALGPNGQAPKPRVKKNTRDYGKAMPTASPQPSPSPFPGEGRLGGI
jgi:hypothetical protein